MKTPTPGPWTAVREDEYRTHIEAPMGVRVIGSFFGQWEDGPKEHAEIEANAVLAAAAPDGLAAAKNALAWMYDPDANANDEFERIAAEFRRDTGMLRPGKDDPVHSDEERAARFEEWRKERQRTVRTALAAFIAKAEGRS